MKSELSFTNKDITTWGRIENCSSLSVQQSNRGHDIGVILESLITSNWCGANRYLHTEVTRSDKAFGYRLRNISDFEKLKLILDGG